jgi:hypothetical protein
VSDGYLKAVLTVIAVALLALVVENGATVSRADSEPTKVQVCNSQGLCAGVEERYFSASGSPAHVLQIEGVVYQAH